jgi:predicted transcriptional regulator
VSENPTLDSALHLLGPLEGRIMRAVWAGTLRQPFVVRDVQKVTPELAYTTLMTTLSRLAEKGILSQDRVPHQRAYEYRSAGTPEQFLSAISREQVSRMVERFGEAALAAFAAELEDLTPAQRERLRRLAAGAAGE